jgi:hypothetical protein
MSIRILYDVVPPINYDDLSPHLTSADGSATAASRLLHEFPYFLFLCLWTLISAELSGPFPFIMNGNGFGHIQRLC